MANNGYLVNGVCSPSNLPNEYAACLSKGYPNFSRSAVFVSSSGSYRTSNGNNVNCYSEALAYLGAASVSSTPNCEVPGPPLTETEQIQAINQFLPYALAFLAVIWGARKVYDTLWSAASRRPASSDHE